MYFAEFLFDVYKGLFHCLDRMRLISRLFYIDLVDQEHPLITCFKNG
uniref:Uncharacterized protein n=1 Tax=Arundo donax TaxID=35708 RepID=A0A0A9AVZ4_ARUDO